LSGTGRGVVKIPGKFDIGEGKYHVDWLMCAIRMSVFVSLRGTWKPA
jgi:hypothetical protein